MLIKTGAGEILLRFLLCCAQEKDNFYSLGKADKYRIGIYLAWYCMGFSFPVPISKRIFGNFMRNALTFLKDDGEMFGSELELLGLGWVKLQGYFAQGISGVYIIR